MDARWIVKAFDIIKDRKPSLLASGEVEVVDPLRLEGVKETFRHGVVLAAAGATHTADHSVAIELLLVLGGQILTAPVRVVNESSRGLSSRDSLRKRFKREILLRSRRGRVPNNLA